MTNYDCLGIDEGCQTIIRFNTNPKQILWKKELKNYPIARALQRIDTNLVLVGYDKGYFIIDINTGNIIHEYNQSKKITSATRLKNKNTILTSMDINDKNHIGIFILDKNDNVIDKKIKQGDYVRLMSITPSNSYLFSTNTFITETDTDLNSLNILYANGFEHAWQSLRLSDGRTIVSAGYGAFMAIFDIYGNLEKKFGEKESVPKEVEPYFYASFQLTKENTILLANWQGHGPNNGNKGKQLLHFDIQGNYIESISFTNEISSLQGLLILN